MPERRVKKLCQSVCQSQKSVTKSCRIILQLHGNVQGLQRQGRPARKSEIWILKEMRKRQDPIEVFKKHRGFTTLDSGELFVKDSTVKDAQYREHTLKMDRGRCKENSSSHTGWQDAGMVLQSETADAPSIKAFKGRLNLGKQGWASLWTNPPCLRHRPQGTNGSSGRPHKVR